ncbi:membrane lipoprotein lipid attachment site-containing protein, partial [Planococcus sp. SIMBA_143]
MKKFIFLFVFTTLLVGCSEEKTDGKNSSNSNKMPNIEQKEEANKTADYTEVYIQEINKTHIII